MPPEPPPPESQLPPPPPEPPPRPPRQPPPFRYGKPEKTNWLKVFLLTALIVAGIGAIAWMIASNKRMPSLTCQTYNGDGLWSAFGRCQEEQ